LCSLKGTIKGNTINDSTGGGIVLSKSPVTNVNTDKTLVQDNSVENCGVGYVDSLPAGNAYVDNVSAFNGLPYVPGIPLVAPNNNRSF